MGRIAAAILGSSLALLGCRADSAPSLPAEAANPEIAHYLDGSVRGTVLAPDGSPVAGAHVAALAADHGFWGDVLSSEPAPTWDDLGLVTTRTDSSGRFHIPRLPREAEYYLLASAEGWATSSPVELGMVGPSRTAASADLVLRNLTLVEIAVIDPEGIPISNALVDEVIYTGRTFIGKPLSPTGSPGRFFINQHLRVALTAEVRAPGFGPAWIVAHLGAGDSRTLTVRLEPAVSIQGIVVDDRGLPIEGARVSATHPTRPEVHSRRERPILTGADGRFEIPGLARGSHNLRASARTARSEDGDAVTVEAPGKGVELRLVRLGGILFKLRVPEGGLVPQEVGFAYSAGSTGIFNWLGGEFRDEYRSPGLGTVRLYPQGYAPLTLNFSVAPGEISDLGEFLLERRK